MSEIKVKTDYVISTNNSLIGASTKLSSINLGLSGLKYSVDSEIRSRRGIGPRLSQASQSVAELQSKIKQLEAFIQQSMFSYSRTENSLCKEAVEVVENNAWKYDLARNTLIGVGAGLLNTNKLLRLANGLQFRMFEKDGQVFIKIVGDKVKSLSDYQRYRQLLKEGLGGSAKWKREWVTNLVNDGIPLYNEGNPGSFYRKNSNILLNSRFDHFETVFNQLDDPFHKIAGRTLVDEMKVWESFTGWKNATAITKAGKGLGILGIGIDVYSNFDENFTKDANGNRDFSAENIKEFSVDTTVDIGTGAAAMAVGAAAGSFFLPPVGTVVGAAAGAVFYGLANWKWGGETSAVDYLKDGANKVVDKVIDVGGELIDKAGDVIDGIGDKLDEVFW